MLHDIYYSSSEHSHWIGNLIAESVQKEKTKDVQKEKTKDVVSTSYGQSSGNIQYTSSSSLKQVQYDTVKIKQQVASVYILQKLEYIIKCFSTCVDSWNIVSEYIKDWHVWSAYASIIFSYQRVSKQIHS